MWEVFNPRDGSPVGTFRFRIVARFVCRLCPILDYARIGEGW